MKKTLLVVTLMFSATLLCSSLVKDSKASALSGSQFQSGRIIDDVVFFNGNGMSVSDIQNFLNSKVPACDTNGTQAYGGTTRAAYGASRGYPAPYTCLKNFRQDTPSKPAESGLCNAYTGGNKSAAEIIYDVGQACGISQKVIITLLEKEQSLITDDWPWSIQYRSATGYGCPDTAPCDAEYYGFFNQVYNAARQSKRYVRDADLFRYRAYRENYIQYNPNAACGGSNVYIQNHATAVLYNYTPYQPNASALNNLYGSGDGCGAYGNRNFWRLFSDWFGNPVILTYGGISYEPVFDGLYYVSNYPDVGAITGHNYSAAFGHFVTNGMREGRLGNAHFNVTSYKNRYPDLRRLYGDNLPMYYRHYILYGKAEGRIATGNVYIPDTLYNGVNYDKVFNLDYYRAANTDVVSVFGDNNILIFNHFITNGMKEGRVGVADFNVVSYKNRNYDLRRVFGGNLPLYYWHYAMYGKAEGRIATGDYLGGINAAGSTNYSSVYEFDYYMKQNLDLKNVFGTDDARALGHFITYGMAEGRQAGANFNLSIYKSRYSDLQSAFGNNNQRYYLHYITHGVHEGRTAI